MPAASLPGLAVVIAMFVIFMATLFFGWVWTQTAPKKDD